MEEQIFLLDGNTLSELTESSFVNELQFQKLLQAYPNLLSGVQINPENPRRWILISREVGVPNQENGNNIWSLDHLFVDQDGIPTLVEVKRSTDTRLRREVVGQMLDYAANSVNYWTISEIKELFEKNCVALGKDPEILLSSLLEDSSMEESFWQIVETNLRAGKIRLLFVADRIPRELKRIIEFLNEQMFPAEVLGLELKQFSNGILKTLVPRIIGHTSASENKKGVRPSNQWSETSFYKELERRAGKQATGIIRKLIDSLRNYEPRLWYGQGARSGSLIPVIDKKDYSNQILAVYTYGKIEILFQFLKDKPPFDQYEKRKVLLSKLNAINGINISEQKLDKRPSIEITLLSDENKLSAFTKTILWLIEEINQHQK